MSDLELIDAVAKKTGESLREIGRRGFILTGPEDAGADLDPECMLDLVDLPETGVVDWDALGFGCREPFYLRSDTCSLTVIAIPPVFIHIPMNAPSGPTPIDMRRGCTSEKGADPPPRR